MHPHSDIESLLIPLSILVFVIFNTIFVSSHMYPANPEGTQVIVGSTNTGYISDTAKNRTHNLFRPRRELIPLGHSDGQSLHPDTLLFHQHYPFIHTQLLQWSPIKPPHRAPFQTLYSNQQRSSTRLVFLLCQVFFLQLTIYKNSICQTTSLP